MRHTMLICCAVIVLAFTASATTYVIEPDGSGDFPTIQAAINASSDGDIIELADGCTMSATYIVCVDLQLRPVIGFCLIR